MIHSSDRLYEFKDLHIAQHRKKNCKLTSKNIISFKSVVFLTFSNEFVSDISGLVSCADKNPRKKLQLIIFQKYKNFIHGIFAFFRVFLCKQTPKKSDNIVKSSWRVRFQRRIICQFVQDTSFSGARGAGCGCSPLLMTSSFNLISAVL